MDYEKKTKKKNKMDYTYGIFIFPIHIMKR